MRWPRRWAIAAIQRYQDNGGGMHYFRVDCNFTPTCSEYTKQAIAHVGVWRGSRLGWRRIRRCAQPDLCQRIHDPYHPDST